jgi:hypothetical protein
MGLLRSGFGFQWISPLLLVVFLAGCATPRIDWAARVGSYTYDQAVLDFGPPDKYAKLTDGTQVSEWLIRRGYTYAYNPWPYGYSPWWYGPYYPSYYDMYTSPNQYLRLTFGPEGRLQEWKKFYR